MCIVRVYFASCCPIPPNDPTQLQCSGLVHQGIISVVMSGHKEVRNSGTVWWVLFVFVCVISKADYLFKLPICTSFSVNFVCSNPLPIFLPGWAFLICGSSLDVEESRPLQYYSYFPNLMSIFWLWLQWFLTAVLFLSSWIYQYFLLWLGLWHSQKYLHHSEIIK